MTQEAWTLFAHELADRAGDVLRRYFRTPLPVERKEDDSPVTRADREVEVTLRAMIHARYPTHGVWGEEDGKEQADAEYLWVVDPIDGTASFISGKPLFTTLIALTHRGVPVLGVIDQPITRERWVGTEGQPTRLNGEIVTARQGVRLEQALLSTTSPFLFAPGKREAYQQAAARCWRETYGGDAYHYAMLATGQLDAVIESGLKPYDFLALCPVITGAGGIITDWHGAPLTLASGGDVLACGDATLHRELMAILHDA